MSSVKTPHHGSANISPALMEAIRAPVGIVSVGADNDYGHPSATQLSPCAASGMPSTAPPR